MTQYHPLAITMWDFSWIERRWAGAGFEDIDRALDELAARGYNAVRIDPFPHLLAEAPEKEWTLVPVWYSNDWGSPYTNRIRLLPALFDFLRKCRERGIAVALSSWYRQDASDVRMKIDSPEKMADIWIATLNLIKQAGLADTILYVDCCNEWPADMWAPFFRNNPPECTWGFWHTPKALDFIRRTLAKIREKYPEIPLTFSFDGMDFSLYREKDLSSLDFIEQHLWATNLNHGEFYRLTGRAKDGRFTEDSYHMLSDNALAVYSARPDYWQELLRDGVRELADCCKPTGLPLATTECWGIVDYKDYPLLEWDWVKTLCSVGVDAACASGRWWLIATSNFACPQFHGMWDDAAWHRRLTAQIRAAQIDVPLLSDKLKRRLTLFA